MKSGHLCDLAARLIKRAQLCDLTGEGQPESCTDTCLTLSYQPEQDFPLFEVLSGPVCSLTERPYPTKAFALSGLDHREEWTAAAVLKMEYCI